MTTFDDKAKNWDGNIQNVVRAQKIASVISTIIGNENYKALEFGCGTGLLSIELIDSFKSIVATDTSKEMLKVFNAKMKQSDIKSIKTKLIDITTSYLPKSYGNFETIYTSMTLHHIIDINSIITKFNKLLYKNGYLCIADLVSEDGKFHDDPNFNGHFGFRKEEIYNYLTSNNFKVIYYNEILEIEKKYDNNILKKFPVFLIIAQKK